LLLLDIKVREQSEENILKGKKIYEPARFMSAKEAIGQLLEMEEAGKKGICDGKRLAMCRIGADDQSILVGSLSELQSLDDETFGAPLNSLVIPSRDLHEIGFEMLKLNAVPNSRLSRLSYSEWIAPV
jgi:diphthine synthase